MPTPGWWDNAVGTLVAGGITGLPLAWWKWRTRRWTLGLPILWVVLVGGVVYYGVRGWIAVPAFLLTPVPAWWLVIASLSGGLIVLALLSVRRRREGQLSRQDWEGLWTDLTEGEQNMIEFMWKDPDGCLQPESAERLQKARGAWNTLTYSLKVRHLIERAPFTGDWTLTARARALMLHRTRPAPTER
jgi:hypothetical protein